MDLTFQCDRCRLRHDARKQTGLLTPAEVRDPQITRVHLTGRTQQRLDRTYWQYSCDVCWFVGWSAHDDLKILADQRAPEPGEKERP